MIQCTYLASPPPDQVYCHTPDPVKKTAKPGRRGTNYTPTPLRAASAEQSAAAAADKFVMEAPLHPTPMARPMMKGKIYVDASNKPTFQVSERAAAWVFCFFSCFPLTQTP